MPKLYDLSTEFAAIIEEVIDAEGVISKELEARLDATGLALHTKVENTVRWIRNLDGDVAALDGEIARFAIEAKKLQARKKTKENLIKRLKGYVKEGMVQAKKPKFEFELFMVWVQRNPPTVEILNEKVVPAKYKNSIPAQKVVDKAAVLDALKHGEAVKGAEFINNRTHLRIS